MFEACTPRSGSSAGPSWASYQSGQLIKSKRNTCRLHVCFFNGTCHSVGVFWLCHEGTAQYYATIPPGRFLDSLMEEGMNQDINWKAVTLLLARSYQGAIVHFQLALTTASPNKEIITKDISMLTQVCLVNERSKLEQWTEKKTGFVVVLPGYKYPAVRFIPSVPLLSVLCTQSMSRRIQA